MVSGTLKIVYYILESPSALLKILECVKGSRCGGEYYRVAGIGMVLCVVYRALKRRIFDDSESVRGAFCIIGMI